MAYDGPIIDVDVHHARASDDELLEYLPARWREFVESPGGGRLVSLSPPFQIIQPLWATARADAVPPSGGPAGSDYETLKEQLLDFYGLEFAFLGHQVGQETGLLNVEYAHAVTEAVNRWCVDTWLARGDDRIVSGVLTSTHLPEVAAAEIRRAGEHPGLVSVLLPSNGLGRPLGNPIHDPIYAAAAEMVLPLHWHVSLGEYMNGSAPYLGGGPHNYRTEIYTVAYQSTATHLTSMIVNGVFEKYPDLKLLITEVGLAWLPWIVMSLDANYAAMKRESKWVRRWPSEYIRERVRVSTQPWESSLENRKRVGEQLEILGWLDEILCFSTDYPHWDNDTAALAEAMLPASWHDRVFHENARTILRLPVTAHSMVRS